MIEECSVIISVGLCYGPSVLDDCCLCCRPVGTSRTTGCVRTPARASCATTPTCTSWYPTHTESTTSGPPVSRAAHVRTAISGENFSHFFVFLAKIKLLWTPIYLLLHIKSCTIAVVLTVKINKIKLEVFTNTSCIIMSFFTLWYAEQVPRLSFRVVRHSVVTVSLGLIINCINTERK